MHHNYGVISGSHACRDCMWPMILDAELYTTSPWEQVLVATRFNITFLPLRCCYEKTSTCTYFLKDVENLTTLVTCFDAVKIVFIRTYSLNTAIAFYSVNEWSNYIVSVWLMVFHVTMHSRFRNWRLTLR